MSRSLFSFILRRLFRNVLTLLRGEQLLAIDTKASLPKRGWYLITFQAHVDPLSHNNILTLNTDQKITVPFTHNGISACIVFAKSETILSTDLAAIINVIRISPIEARLKLLKKFNENEQSKTLSSTFFGRANNFNKSEQIARLTIAAGQTYGDLMSQLRVAEHDFMFVDDGSIELYEDCEKQLVGYFHTHNFISFDYCVAVESSKGFKTQYTPEMNIPYLICYDYIQGCYIVARDILIQALNALSSEDIYHPHELVLTIISENDIRSKRVSQLLAVRRAVKQQNICLTKISDRVKKLVPNAIVGIKNEEVYRLTLSSPSDAKVSIIIPAKDQLYYTKYCVESILNKTQGIEYEILLVNNNSVEKETLEWLEYIVSDPRVKVVDYPYPFNFSAINNYAVTQAKYEYLLFLNNDTEVISKNWLHELIGWASVDNIGAVGCKLLYEDKRIQHAGVVIGIQNAAAHVHRFYASEHPGYMHRLECTQYFSAVTAAALAIRKSVFNETGGFDENKYKIAYNDVDLCLKCQKLGLNNVWVSDVSLFHYESKSRAHDLGIKRLSAYSKELNALRQDWKVTNFDDPFYNPNLTKLDEYFH